MVDEETEATCTLVQDIINKAPQCRVLLVAIRGDGCSRAQQQSEMLQSRLQQACGRNLAGQIVNDGKTTFVTGIPDVASQQCLDGLLSAVCKCVSCVPCFRDLIPDSFRQLRVKVQVLVEQQHRPWLELDEFRKVVGCIFVCARVHLYMRTRLHFVFCVCSAAHICFHTRTCTRARTSI